MSSVPSQAASLCTDVFSGEEAFAFLFSLQQVKCLCGGSEVLLWCEEELITDAEWQRSASSFPALEPGEEPEPEPGLALSAGGGLSCEQFFFSASKTCCHFPPLTPPEVGSPV